MKYYLVGLNLDSHLKLQLQHIKDEFQTAMNISVSGKMFVEPYTNLLDNDKFVKLIDYVEPEDVLIFYDLSRSFGTLIGLYKMLEQLYKRRVHFINIAVGNINSVDNVLIYMDMAKLLPAINSYTEFLKALYTGTLASYNFSAQNTETLINPLYADFISHTIRVAIRNYEITPTVSEFLEGLNASSFKEAMSPYLPEINSLIIDSSWEGLESHMRFLRGEYYVPLDTTS